MLLLYFLFSISVVPLALIGVYGLPVVMNDCFVVPATAKLAQIAFNGNAFIFWNKLAEIKELHSSVHLSS